MVPLNMFSSKFLKCPKMTFRLLKPPNNEAEGSGKRSRKGIGSSASNQNENNEIQISKAILTNIPIEFRDRFEKPYTRSSKPVHDKIVDVDATAVQEHPKSW